MYPSYARVLYVFQHRISGHYAIGEYIDEIALNNLQLMPNDIYYEYCVAMSYKTWPFKSIFDLLVLRVAETGIQKYWELQVWPLVLFVFLPFVFNHLHISMRILNSNI